MLEECIDEGSRHKDCGDLHSTSGRWEEAVREWQLGHEVVSHAHDAGHSSFGLMISLRLNLARGLPQLGR